MMFKWDDYCGPLDRGTSFCGAPDRSTTPYLWPAARKRLREFAWSVRVCELRSARPWDHMSSLNFLPKFVKFYLPSKSIHAETVARTHYARLCCVFDRPDGLPPTSERQSSSLSFILVCETVILSQRCVRLADHPSSPVGVSDFA